MTYTKSASEIITQPKCFVIMPFTNAKSIYDKYDELGKDELDTIFDVYSNILKEIGYIVFRANSVGDILSDIIDSLSASDLVVADLTSLNPNVMYELGIRHGFTKQTIMTTQDLKEIPFDLSKFYCVEYKWKTTKDRDKLKTDFNKVLNQINNNPKVKYGPVHSYLGNNYMQDSKEKNEYLNQLDALSGDLTDLVKAFRIELFILIDNKNIPISQEDNQLYLDKSNLSADLLNESIELSEYLKNILSLNFPSIEYQIARNKIISNLNTNGAISSFNLLIRMTYKHIKMTKKWTLGDIIHFNTILHRIRIDSADIREAVIHDKYHEPLDLYSLSVMKLTNDENAIVDFNLI